MEREDSARASVGIKRFAGVRTFLLLGLVSGIAAELSAAGAVVAGPLLFAAAALLVVSAFTIHALAGDLDARQEVSTHGPHDREPRRPREELHALVRRTHARERALGDGRRVRLASLFPLRAAHGGTRGVGRATTNAVGGASVVVLALDFILTKLLISWLY